MAYFAYNLPAEAPKYIHESQREHMNALLRSICSRMDKLEEAANLSGLTPATFAEYAKTLFDTRFERFEQMSPVELADYAYQVHLKGYEATPRLEWPNATVVVDSAFLTTKEWEAIRHLGIGGSDAAVLNGSSPYKVPIGLYYDKTWTPMTKKDDGKQAVFDRGHYMEPQVIKAFCKMYGATVIPETRMFRSKKYPAAIADVDAIVRFPDGNIYVFEAKTTIAQNYDAWVNGKIPGHYISQTRQYPAVLDDDRIKGTYIGCLFTHDSSIQDIYCGSEYDENRFLSRFVKRDERDERTVLELDQQFYDKHLLTRTKPPLSGDGALVREVIAAKTGPADPNLAPVELDEEYEEAIQRYLELKVQEKRLNDEAAGLKVSIDAWASDLIAALGERVEGRMVVKGGEPGQYYEVKYAPRKKTTTDLALLEAKYPEAYAECVATDPCASRTFSVRVKTQKPLKKK